MLRRNASFLLLSLVLAFLALLLPLPLWLLDLPVVGNTYGDEHELFELFGLSASVAMALASAVAFYHSRQRSSDKQAPSMIVLLPLFLLPLIGFHYLGQITEYSVRSWDYLCYEGAARTLLQGGNLYLDTVEQCYLYPPLLAQTLAVAYRTFALVGVAPAVDGWFLVFYLYQAAQLALILTTAYLLYLFARSLSISPLPTAILVALLYLVNNPLLRTLRHNQVNLWMLAFALLALLLVPRRPWLAGLAVALGIHLKLYTVVFLPVWLLRKRWRPVLSAVIFFLLILLLQVAFASGWSGWQQFLTFYLEQPLQRFVRFRNSSLQSVVFGTLSVFGLWPYPGNEVVGVIGQLLVFLLVLVSLGWFARRFWRREQLLRSGASSRPRLYGHLLDALAFVLLVGPVTWEHHFLLALPLIVWAWAARGKERPWLVVLSAFLMLAMPTFDLYPFSYHRLVGLLLWLVMTRPTAVVPLIRRLESEKGYAELSPSPT